MRKALKVCSALLSIVMIIAMSSCGGTQRESEEVTQISLTVDCSTVIESGLLSEELAEMLPQDGIILSCDAEFTEGESVADIFLRETKNAGILTEVTFTPMYGSVYIEGIANLYEFDCGELSGWMYKVNGEFPGYGCSEYYPKDGDVVEWVYTCDLGKDVGNTDFSNKD